MKKIKIHCIILGEKAISFIMKKLLVISLLLGLLSSFGHFYLAKRTYQLEAGTASVSRICSIGENINCDSALLSPYARFFGMSLSNFGLGFNLALSGLLMIFLLFGASAYWKNISFYLAGGIALPSIVMAVISLRNHLFCPVCWTLYLLSFLVFGLLFLSFKSDLNKPVSFIFQNIKHKSFYILGGSILFISLFFHINFMTIFDLKDQKEVLTALFQDWQYGKAVQIKTPPLLRKGSRESSMLIVEFADFLCPACKNVQPALKRFLNHFPDVKFQFYVYPLDGTCNPSIGLTRSGLSCELSRAVVCADRQDKGGLLHDLIFKKQNHFLGVQGDEEKSKTLLNKMLVQLGIDVRSFETCMQDPKVLERVKQSALVGDQANIRGTPSFFINGKSVQYSSSNLLIFKTIYDYLKKEGK